MAHDQEKFYADAELENGEFVQPNQDEEVVEQEENLNEVDDMKFFLELLRHIRAAINAGTNIPLSSKKIIDADKCLMIIDDLERNLPDAIQYGLQMFSERERILSNAQSAAMSRVSSAEMRATAALEKAKNEAEQRIIDAENEANMILQDAQERADHMIDESEIVRQAREEARIIRNDARVEASELRLKATHEAYQLLASVEDQLNEACKSVRRRRAELDTENE
ncbi:MAG: ATP synthase F0 subunit B [Clostridiales bacterium]|nr:ATP synthase F0 subunit B [Clostridiales bacterium]